MGELEQLLKNSGDDYENTPDEEDTPSGPSFMLQLQSAECAVSSKGGFIIKRAHLIIDGEYEGVTVRDNLHPLNGGFCTRRFKDWVRVMGYEPPESKMDIEETVATIAGDDPVYMASLTKSGGFTNVVCSKLLEMEDRPRAPSTAERPRAARKTSEPATAAEPEPEIAKGDTVSFTDDEGSEVTGTVTKVGNGVADVDTPDADYRDVPVGSLSAQPPEPEPQQDDELVDLIALAQASGIDVSDDTERDDLVQIVNNHKWNKAELTDEEVALLEGVGVKFKAQARPKPSAARKTSKKPKKTAKRR